MECIVRKLEDGLYVMVSNVIIEKVNNNQQTIETVNNLRFVGEMFQTYPTVKYLLLRVLGRNVVPVNTICQDGATQGLNSQKSLKN